jgi:hypothetical protein
VGQCIAARILSDTDSEVKMKRVFLIVSVAFASIVNMVQVVAVIVIVTVAANVIFNPLWWSTDRIEKWMLRKIPIGTSIDETIEIIETNNWEIDSILDSGYYIQNDEPYLWSRLFDGDDRLPICSRSIIVFLGNFWFGIGWVEIYFGFDDDSLIDISIKKTITGL